ncbi:MAG: winged helix-turn-helix transcriptional regulator [Oscillospiraceae bacterium]|nr:winged helix-turn-helix transcriptional regulator [Oscillospiraceae bacterium]
MLPSYISAYFDILGKAQKVYSKYLEPVSRKWELTRSELDVMLFLHNNPGYSRATDIVSHRGMTKSHVSMSVSSLVERGLLLRQFSPDDRRTVHLILTEQGHLIAEEARILQQQFFEVIYTDVSREEMAVLRKVTLKVCENIDNIDKVLANP